MEVFIVISKPRNGDVRRESNTACFTTMKAAREYISSREEEYRHDGWDEDETLYFFVEKHELRS
jgi:hypothetical protein